MQLGLWGEQPSIEVLCPPTWKYQKNVDFILGRTRASPIEAPCKFLTIHVLPFYRCVQSGIGVETIKAMAAMLAEI